MVKAEKQQRDVKKEERRRERNEGEGVFIPSQWLKGTSFDQIGKKGPGVHVRKVLPSNIGRCVPACLPSINT